MTCQKSTWDGFKCSHHPLQGAPRVAFCAGPESMPGWGGWEGRVHKGLLCQLCVNKLLKNKSHQKALLEANPENGKNHHPKTQPRGEHLVFKRG